MDKIAIFVLQKDSRATGVAQEMPISDGKTDV
jgi:hypothetical protein